ncbi:MAG: hypothetical protein ACK478_00820 [Flavobacteriales bacterium]|jgi:hypothetical protein
MKIFLIKIAIASLLAGLLHLGFSLFSDGKTDDFYLRFTTPQAPSLIIGSSRAAQGIQPDSLQSWCAESGFATPIFNFAFTSQSSPFGETYHRAILEKLDNNAADGLFIIAVEPYTLGEVILAKETSPIEQKGQLYGAHWFNRYPNWEYLLHHYNYGWGRLALSSTGIITNSNTLHENGWLEVNVAVDSTTAAARAANNIRDRRGDIGKFKLNPSRFDWLNKTISVLKPQGSVVIIRMPISSEFYAFENELAPEFNRMVNETAQQQGVIYHDFNYMSHLLSFKDGHHMQLSSTSIFSGYLHQWLSTEFSAIPH